MTALAHDFDPAERAPWEVLEGRRFEDTDVGNAERFVHAHGHRFRWVPAWGAWLWWDGRRWARDERGEHVEAAKAVARAMLDEARALLAGDDRKRAIAWALKTEAVQRIRAMLELARSAPGVSVQPDELDADPWLLNTLSGVVDLRTGRLLEPDPARLVTKLAPTVYRWRTEAPTWDAFLATVLPDADLREFVARALGYSLVGVTTEQVLLIPFGSGANGKTTLLEAVRHVLGDYAATAEPDLLLTRRDAHPTGLADLHGARFVTCTESDEGRRFAEATVKRLTGGDRIKARRMHKDFYDFVPSHTLWLATNHRPDVRGSDHAIWRRLRLVPFTVTIADVDQDPELPTRLAAEAEGILAWLVAACRRWQTDGLTEPAAVVIATAAYRAEQDALGAFLDDRCELGDHAGMTPAAALFETYSTWCKANGEESLNQKRFGAALAERGLDRVKHGPQRRWHWIGLRLIDDMEMNP